MSHTKVSVVVPARDVAHCIHGQLEALSQQSYSGPWEVVVADNGSVDETVAVVEQWKAKLPDLRVTDAGARPGINHARNRGTAVTQGDLVLLCDSDDRVDKAWITEMVRAFDDGARIMGGDLNRVRAHVADGPQPLDGRVGKLPSSLKFLPWAQGANCGFARDVHTAIGGFDETYLGGGDETDFFWRAQLAGHGLRFVPDALVHYLVRGTSKGLFRQNIAYGRSHVKLYAAYRDKGMPAPTVRALLRRHKQMLHDALHVITRERRQRLLRHAGITVGRMNASLELRAFYP